MAGETDDADRNAENDADVGLHGDLRSFGRRRGRKLSERQDKLVAELLPRVRLSLQKLDNRAAVSGQFSNTPSEIWLEIGFGGGEHLVHQAEANPHIGIIGCEPFLDGVVKVLAHIEQDGLRNIRLHDDDARAVLKALPDASISRVFVLFPDPWPKRKHQKRRLVNRALLAQIARVLVPGGELRLGTDIADYARTMLMALQGERRLVWTAQGPDDWRVRPADWPKTRYEAKAEREGRRSCYLLIRRAG